ncbi:Uncharacterized conserved protein [Phaffia rhodozyma]|uniref:Protein YAE1 n=1 Tax=Phaffia rhodozyma TaxID=264483 RepID=A0A0F7SRT8_PHARH|nr:Uncharacterized conserved protein [Phaffia rhodozyma]
MYSTSSNNHIDDEDEDWLSEVPAISSALNTASSNQEWSTLHERFTNVGYKEGISSGKLSTIQTGFDQGLAQSMPSSRTLGFIRGYASSLLASLCPPSSSHLQTCEPRMISVMSPSDRASIVEDVRDLLRDLSNVRMSEVVPVDPQAEEHAKAHGGEKEWEVQGESGEMDGLESLMGGLGEEQRASRGVRKVDLVGLNARLGRLVARCRAPSAATGGSDMRT